MAVPFDPVYKKDIFYFWYNNGRPGYQVLHRIMPPDETGTKPSISALQVWVYQDFKPQAEELDDIVRKELEGKLVKEKVEMFQRHSKVGVKMQDIALKFFDEHEEELTAHSAVRLLVEGVRIERESRGVGDLVEKLSKSSDEDLFKQIEDIVIATPVLEEPND